VFVRFLTRLHEVLLINLRFFVCLLKESVSLHECTASNNGIFSEYRIATDVEGSGHEVIWGNIRIFTGD
jgi:hypothetical protein